MNNTAFQSPTIITAGSTYLDIDAYACCVAMAELLQLQGKNAIAYSKAACNYSICSSLVEEGQILKVLPDDVNQNANYIIVDVSDPNYIKDTVPLERVVAIYDHHVGFEDYWTNRLGERAHIEFIGAAATLIYREWKTGGLLDRMSQSTARLLIAAILDNTLNLSSSNTTAEDRQAFQELCQRACVDDVWCAAYFAEVQAGVEADLKNAVFNDLKIIRDNELLPTKVAQLCVWDTNRILAMLPEIRQWFVGDSESWMLNIIDIQHRYSCFVCEDVVYQKKLETVFGTAFQKGVARLPVSYLRKEIIKKTRSYLKDKG